MISPSDLERWAAHSRAAQEHAERAQALVGPAQEQAERTRDLAEQIAKWPVIPGGEPRGEPHTPAPAPRLPPPNFAGDQVKYERRDENGTTQGHMHRNLVEAERAKGVAIEIVDEHKPLQEQPRDMRLAVISAINSALTDSDHYFLADRDDVDEAKRQAWVDYRAALRAAKQRPDLRAMAAALPARDPKGFDPFVDFRGITGKERTP